MKYLITLFLIGTLTVLVTSQADNRRDTIGRLPSLALQRPFYKPNPPYRYRLYNYIRRPVRSVDPNAGNDADKEEVFVYIPDDEEAALLESLPDIDTDVNNGNRKKRSIPDVPEQKNEDDDDVLIYIPDDEEKNLLADIPEIPDNVDNEENEEKYQDEIGARRKRSPQSVRFHDLLYRYPTYPTYPKFPRYYYV